MMLKGVGGFEVDREEVERAKVAAQHDPELMTNMLSMGANHSYEATEIVER